MLIYIFKYIQVRNDVGGGETVARVSALDKEMKQRADDAREKGKVLRYIIGVDGIDGTEEATAGIREVDTSHPYASLEGAAFCVMYKTKVSYPGNSRLSRTLKHHLQRYFIPGVLDVTNFEMPTHACA